ncbi:hypothetical protein KAI19_03435 [bacterium]|nr:hypothetical protein [bacterium]
MEVKATCLLFNIMYRAKKLRKPDLYKVVEKVCIEIGKQFPNSYCDNWGDSIPYMLEGLEGAIKQKGNNFVYVNKNMFNKKYIDTHIMRMYSQPFRKALPVIVEKELSRLHA